MIRRPIAAMAAAALSVAVGACAVTTTPVERSSSQAGDGAAEPAQATPLARLGAQLKADPPADVPTAGEFGSLPAVLDRVPTTDPVVFITIDDGYSTSAKVAAVLAQTGVPVTSFLTANSVSSSHKYFAKVSELDGQVIQNHSIDHPQMPNLSEQGQQEQICATSEQFVDWFGARPWMFRPPYGEHNDTTKVAAKACGIDYLVLWNVSLPGPGPTLRYASGDQLQAGDIILTHWRDDLADNVLSMLQQIRRQGFKVAALQDYLPVQRDT